uniref:DUF1985 domain-containing protein n=1 Tax=Cannabis sativa TaxID=3483 RepID=A0A803PF24_CANSA
MALKLKLSVFEHFTSRLTYRGLDKFKYINDKFEAIKLIERVKASPFGPFWEVGELTFSGALVHNLLLQKTKVENEKEDEIWFYVGKTNMRFGRLEFGLIFGLLMGIGPTEEEIEAKSSDR